MGSRTPLFVLAGVVLATLSVGASDAGAESDDAAVRWGDRIVTGIELVEDSKIVLDGDVTIRAGGILTLRNVTLTVNTPSPGEHGVYVEPGGSLLVHESTIKAGAESDGFEFAVHGSRFEMRDSELHGAGWGDPIQLNHGNDPGVHAGSRGLAVTSDNAVITGNVFSHNHAGLILTGDGVDVENNVIHSNTVHALYMSGATNARIANNVMRSSNAEPVFMIESHDNHFIGNTIELTDNYRPMISTVQSHRNTFEDNEISGTAVGIALSLISNDNVVTGNHMALEETGVFVHGWNNEIVGNTIVPNSETGILDTGIWGTYAYNSLIADNRVADVLDGAGIVLRHSASNTVVDNQLSAAETSHPETGGVVCFSLCSNNVIHGNRISGFDRGISLLYSSDGNVVTGNTVSDAVVAPVVVEGSSGNSIYANNLDAGAGGSAYDDTGTNDWDHDGQGNFWADASGPSSPIEPAGADHFPSTEPIAIEEVPLSPTMPATPPPEGDLFSASITGDEIIEGQTLRLEYIYVDSGASLTLRNVTVLAGASASEPSAFDVAPDGTLIIEDSVIQQVDHGNGLFLQDFGQGSTFIIRNSDIVVAGFEFPYGGLQFYDGNNVVIEDSRISHAELVFFGKGPAYELPRDERLTARVAGTTISSSWQAIIIEGGDVVLEGNSIEGTIRAGIQATESIGTIIKNNTINGTWASGIVLDNVSEAQVDGNTITGMRVAGFDAIATHRGTGNIIRDNTLEATLAENRGNTSNGGGPGSESPSPADSPDDGAEGTGTRSQLPTTSAPLTSDESSGQRNSGSNVIVWVSMAVVATSLAVLLAARLRRKRH